MKHVYLTLAAMVRDQEHYVREWLTYHHLAGVERFIIVLHKCVDHTESEIRRLPFFDTSIRLHHVTNDEQRAQMGAFQWMLKTYGMSTEWMLFVDSDEFFLGTAEDDLRTILSRYERFSGLAAHWLMFGASGQVVRPPMPSIKYFTERIPDSRFVHRGVKSAVKPREVTNILSPHLFLTKRGTVRENFELVDPNGIWQCRDHEPVWNIIRCNHYNTRSMEDWVSRRRRGSCNDFRLAANYNVEHFYRYNN
ncbi:MAG: glycosyltransferase family 2 protein [Planctomycetaceae bacterium]|jgi:hypothetical protein|nr:glycosyltransferase family 2 protein [Planctomycetaceae bacterium]